MTTTGQSAAATSSPPPTHVSDMPPLHVTKAGIPTDEHVPVHVPQSVIDWQVFHRRARIVIGTVATLCLLLGVVLLVGATRTQQASTARHAPAPTPVGLISPFTGAPLTGVITF